MPHDVNISVACSGTFLVPDDIVIIDDDGIVLVPVALAKKVIKHGSEPAEREDFSREPLS